MRTKETKAVTKRFFQLITEIMSVKRAENQKEWNLRAFARKLGHQGSNFHKMKTLERDVSLDMVEKVVRLYKANPVWLFTGTGSRYLADKKSYEAATLTKKIVEMEGMVTEMYGEIKRMKRKG